MTRIAERSALSAEEYLAWERLQEFKHEFFRGEVFAMSGGSPRHALLSMNVADALAAGLRSRGCRKLSSDLRVGVHGDRYVYPDLSIVCGKPEFENGTTDVLINPSMIVEVLSPTTEQYDRGLKWQTYRQLASLTDYLLVSQTEPLIEHFRRAADLAWTYRAAGPGERVTLTNGAELDVDLVFEGAFEYPGA